MGKLRDLAYHWGATPTERDSAHPGAAFATEPFEVLVRAIDVEADRDVVFRWLCQLRVAPYSYDWLDNGGRRSPRTLTSGMDQLAVGQRVMIGTIVAFDPGRSFTVLSSAWSDRIFGGPIVLTYQVAAAAQATKGSRIVVYLAVTAQSAPARVRRALLAWGDLVMMRRQLLTLKRLAERDQSRVHEEVR
jgi:hypothetical protein